MEPDRHLQEHSLRAGTTHTHFHYVLLVRFLYVLWAQVWPNCLILLLGFCPHILSPGLFSVSLWNPLSALPRLKLTTVNSALTQTQHRRPNCLSFYEEKKKCYRNSVIRCYHAHVCMCSKASVVVLWQSSAQTVIAAVRGWVQMR